MFWQPWCEFCVFSTNINEDYEICCLRKTCTSEHCCHWSILFRPVHTDRCIMRDLDCLETFPSAAQHWIFPQFPVHKIEVLNKCDSNSPVFYNIRFKCQVSFTYYTCVKSERLVVGLEQIWSICCENYLFFQSYTPLVLHVNF